MGSVNLIKMSALPKFTYLFRQAPITIPAGFFKQLDSIVVSFIWNGRVPRIVRTTLQLPVARRLGSNLFYKILLGGSSGDS